MKARVHYSVPMLQVMDVERSVEFYKLLGFTANEILKHKDGVAFWASMDCHKAGDEQQSNDNYTATIMFARGQAPIDRDKQGMVLYMYSLDLPALRARIIEAGGEATEIVPRFYMEKGEITVTDPDGYCILIGQE